MDIKQIYYIVTLAQEGTMQRTAERVHISQPALSQAYKNLEKELGVVLFEKDGRKLKLTEEGSRFCAQAQRVLQEYDKLTSIMQISSIHKNYVFRYYTDVVDNADDTLMMYSTLHPECEFKRIYSSSGTFVSDLKKSYMDFSLTLRKIDEPELYCEKLIDEPVIMLLNASSPLAGRKSIRISELNGETLTMYQNAASLRALFEDFFKDGGAKPSRITEVYEPIIQIQRNGGVMFMPESTYRALSKANKLGDCAGVLVEDEFCRRRVFLTCTRDKLDNDIYKTYFAFLRKYHRLSLLTHCLPGIEEFQN